MGSWLNCLPCPKCGDPVGLKDPTYAKEDDRVVLVCQTCKAEARELPMDARDARTRRRFLRAFTLGIAGRSS